MGYPSKWEVGGASYDYTATYPYSYEEQSKFTADLITMLKRHNHVNGLSWWYESCKVLSNSRFFFHLSCVIQEIYLLLQPKRESSGSLAAE